jgi:transcriptional regulator with XRE-family HTH domain
MVKPEKFGAKLDTAIKTRGRSLSWLARAVGLAQSQISNFVHGKRRPYLDQGHAIAHALGVPLDWLADDAQDVEQPAQTGRPYLDALIEKHGIEACVRWILNGAATQGTTVELVTPPPAPAQSPKSSAG